MISQFESLGEPSKNQPSKVKVDPPVGFEHLAFGSAFQELLSHRHVEEQRPLSLSLCYTNRLNQHSNILGIGEKVRVAAEEMQASYESLGELNRGKLSFRNFATQSFNNANFQLSQDQDFLDRQRVAMHSATSPQLTASQIGKVETLCLNDRAIVALWDEVNLPVLKSSSYQVAMLVTSIAVLARQHQDGVSDNNGYFAVMKPEMLIPSSSYLAALAHTALHEIPVSIGTYFKMNSEWAQVGRLNAVFKSFVIAVTKVLEDKIEHLTGVINQMEYPLSDIQQYRTDLLGNLPIGNEYNSGVAKALHFAKLISTGELSSNDLINVQVGTYVGFEHPVSCEDLPAGMNANFTLYHMANELIENFFRTIMVDHQVKITNDQMSSIRQLTIALGELEISKRVELAEEIKFPKPNVEQLRALLNYFSDRTLVSHHTLQKQIFRDEVPASEIKSVNGLLTEANASHYIFERMVKILDRQNDGLRSKDLVPLAE